MFHCWRELLANLPAAETPQVLFVCGFGRVATFAKATAAEEHVEHVERFWKQLEQLFYAAQHARRFKSAARFRGEAHKEQIFWYNLWHKFDDNV